MNKIKRRKKCWKWSDHNERKAYFLLWRVISKWEKSLSLSDCRAVSKKNFVCWNSSYSSAQIDNKVVIENHLMMDWFYYPARDRRSVLTLNGNPRHNNKKTDSTKAMIIEVRWWHTMDKKLGNCQRICQFTWVSGEGGRFRHVFITHFFPLVVCATVKKWEKERKKRRRRNHEHIEIN